MFPIARDIRYPREIHDRTQKEKSDYKKRGKKKRVEEKANAAFGPLFSSTASTTGGVTGRFHPPKCVSVLCVYVCVCTPSPPHNPPKHLP